MNSLQRIETMTEEEKDPVRASESDKEDSYKELVKRSQSGDSEAMEEIYQRLKRPLFNLIYRYTYERATAEDLLHDVFIKVFNHIHDVNEEGAFVGWVYRIAINTSLSHLRSKKSKVRDTMSLDALNSQVADRSQAKPESFLLRKPLERAIKTLPPKLRSVFLLHDVQGYKHAEVSQMLGCSLGTSKSQLFKARMKIRHQLNKMEFDGSEEQ
jgi:RNA polymerase sigma-70 factor (ECF subfamily)